MKYDELYHTFTNLFPEDRAVFDQLELDADVDEHEDGMHIMFGMVIVPYIRRMVNESPSKTKKIFDFLEKMELDENPDIGNVAEVSVLEALMTDEGGMKNYMDYIGPASLKAARYMSQFYNIEPF